MYIKKGKPKEKGSGCANEVIWEEEQNIIELGTRGLGHEQAQKVAWDSQMEKDELWGLMYCSEV